MQSDSDQQGSVALIGGITGGIGSALAQQLIEAGWRVGGFNQSSERTEAFQQSHPDCQVWTVNARQPAEVNDVFDMAESQLGPVRAYIHCIGSILLKPAHMLSDEDWAEVLDLNLNTAFYALRAATNQMRRHKDGVVLLMSSVAGRSGLANHEAIAAAKGGIEGLVRAAAATYASLGVRVNGLAPGLVDTDAAGPLLASDQMRQLSSRMHPLGRVGEPQEIAALLAWLCSPAARWVTGQIWSIDGGMHSLVPKPRM